jgi:hypothetical protein
MDLRVRVRLADKQFKVVIDAEGVPTIVSLFIFLRDVVHHVLGLQLDVSISSIWEQVLEKFLQIYDVGIVLGTLEPPPESHVVDDVFESTSRRHHVQLFEDVNDWAAGKGKASNNYKP